MPNRLIKTPYDDWTYKIIGHAMSVHRKRVPGCREDTYQRALEVHFTEGGLAYVGQAHDAAFEAHRGVSLG